MIYIFHRFASVRFDCVSTLYTMFRCGAITKTFSRIRAKVRTSPNVVSPTSVPIQRVYTGGVANFPNDLFTTQPVTSSGDVAIGAATEKSRVSNSNTSG